MIKDLILVDLKIINDKRGDILHMLRNDDRNFTGITHFIRRRERIIKFFIGTNEE